MTLDGLVPWKKRMDSFQDNDHVSGMGDQVDTFDDMESPGLSGSPTEVKFIQKDETNAKAMNHMGFRWWEKKKDRTFIEWPTK